MSHIRPELLETIVKFIYTGTITITREVAADILESVTCLQIEDRDGVLTKEITKVLCSAAKKCVKFEELFYIWNVSVTYDLEEVLETVLSMVDIHLESFLASPEDQLWLGYLGWEEVRQVLARPELCVQSETVVLQWAVAWARDKVTTQEDFARLQELLLQLRLGTMDKKLVRRQLADNFGELCDVTSPLPTAATQQLPRGCRSCHYLVQYKHSKTQIRNIEDFVDSGQKSMFLSFNLSSPDKQSSCRGMTSMASMVSTAAGHYGRPVTSGSVLVRWRHLLLVIGGAADSQRDKASCRPDILVFNAQKRCWVTSLKQFVRINAGFRLQDVVQVDRHVFLLIVPTQVTSVTSVQMPSVDRICLELACEQYKLDRMSIAKIPEELWFKDFAAVGAEGALYLVAEGAAWLLDLRTWEWHKLPPPIGTIGSGRPVVAWCPPCLYLVSARLEDSTNVLQQLDPATRQWRRLAR